MSTPKIVLYFRADGSLQTGYGHVMRALALAELLKNSFDCRFLIHNPDAFLEEEILETCSALIKLPAFATVEEEALYLTRNTCKPDDFFLTDGYKFTAEYQRIIRAHCQRLVCIDDIYQTHFYADAVINHAEGISEKKYSREAYTQLYLGARYAILRKAFHKTGQGIATTRSVRHHAFINMGGTDPQNYTLKALRKALSVKGMEGVEVVVGSLYPFKASLESLIAKHPQVNVRIHVNLNAAAMARLMRNSTIGLCAASTVSYEYARVGGVLFLYNTVSNQRHIYAALRKAGVGFPTAELSEKLSELHKITWRKNYFRKRDAFFEGNPAQNLRAVFSYLLALQAKK